MTNSDTAIREFAIKWGRQCLDMMVGQECIIDDSEAMLSDLTALISEHYYPKEFVEWWGKILIETHGQYGSMEIPIQIGGLRTMDEIFEYWKANEQ